MSDGGGGLRFEVVIDDSKGTPVIRKIGDETDKLGGRGKGLDALRGRFDSLASSFRSTLGGLQGLIAAAAAGAGMGAVVREGIRFNAAIEQTSTSFRVLLGDQAKANALMKELVTFAAETPFQLEEVAAAEKTMIGAGMQGVEYLRKVGDAASFANRPLTEVALAFARIKSGSFGEGFERLREMNIATREMLEAKGLRFDSGGQYKGSARDALEAIFQIAEERFGGMTQAQARTWSGLMSTLRDSWAMFAGKLTAPLFDKLKPKINEAISAFSALTDSPAVRKLSEVLAKGVLDVVNGLVALIGRVAEFVTAHGDLVNVVLRGAAAFVVLGGAVSIVAAILNVNPWIALATAVAAVASLVIGWISRIVSSLGGWSVAWAYVKASALAAMDYLHAYLRISWEAIKALGSNWEATGRALGETLKAAFMTGVDAVVAFGRSAWEVVKALGQRWKDLGNLILGAITFDRSKIAASWEGIKEGMGRSLDRAQGYFSGVGRDRWAQIGSLWGEALGAEFSLRYRSIMDETDAKAKALFAEAERARAQAAADRAGAGGGGGASEGETGGRPSISTPEPERTSAAEKILAGSKAGFKSWTEYFNAWVEETMAGVWGVVDSTASIIGDAVSSLFESAIFDAKTFGQATHQIFSNMKRAIVREIIDAGVSYGLQLLRMGLLHSAFQKKVTADVLAATAAATSAKITETAATRIKAGAEVKDAAAEIYAAHAWIPFVGVQIATGLIGEMLGVMAGISAAGLVFARGGLVPGGGAGVEDRTPILVSGGEYVMPKATVDRYGVGFMDALRAGDLAAAGSSLTVNVNLGNSGFTEREVEEELAPALERLAKKRRTRLLVRS